MTSKQIAKKRLVYVKTKNKKKLKTLLVGSNPDITKHLIERLLQNREYGKVKPPQQYLKNKI